MATRVIETSYLGTVIAVVFRRLGDASIHTILFENVVDAREKATEIEEADHLELIGVTDATFAGPINKGF